MILTVWGDSGERTIDEAYCYAASVREQLHSAPSQKGLALDVVVRDRLASRPGTFARVAAFGVVEPRLVTLEEPRAAVTLPGKLKLRCTEYLAPSALIQLVRVVLEVDTCP